jgi:glycosyltransferase involved in cell wall biosynthesis
MPTKEPFISFVTPIFNEEGIISVMLKNLHDVIAGNPLWNAEVILIEDGSKDGTQGILETEVLKYPEIQLILHETNKGWTASMKEGIGVAKGEYIMYVGADEEFDCSEIPSFIAPLLKEGDNHADLVLGVRWQRNAYVLHRFFMSVIYIFFLNSIYGIRINDYNWSQVWSREFLNRIEIRSKSLFMLPEIIIKAHDLGYKVKEVPSNHRGRQHGKSSLNIKIFGFALWESLTFWWYRRSKTYRPSI